jgi:hypothetical protein
MVVLRGLRWIVQRCLGVRLGLRAAVWAWLSTTLAGNWL